MDTLTRLKDLTDIDILKEAKDEKWFVGRPFALDFFKSHVLINDERKQAVGGIAQGTFLLAFYDNEHEVEEAVLLRATRPTKLPTDNEIVGSMIEYYKDGIQTSGQDTQLDAYTKYEFSFSGLECRVLGTFYRTKDRDGNPIIEFGADLENYYSAHHYKAYKVTGPSLLYIVNQRDSDVTPGNSNEFEIGRVRYSSSRRFQDRETEEVKVYINPKDFLGKRTSLFGMTRTGKSNTVKKLIEATTEISSKADLKKLPSKVDDSAENLKDFMDNDAPKFPVGQIIFDINGEYANANLQDEGTAIFEKYREMVTRYSVVRKPGFKVMKVNFYRQILQGFELVRSYLSDDTAIFTKSFIACDLNPPLDPKDFSQKTRHDRKIAAYLCCLHQAGFKASSDFKVTFTGAKDINDSIRSGSSLDPSKGISLDDATTWFSWVWDNQSDAFFTDYQKKKGRPWVDEELKSILIFLTRKGKAGGNITNTGFRKLMGILNLHTDTVGESFDKEILERLRLGEIIIIDLSQGDPAIQRLYSERIVRKVFKDAMNRFTKALPNNFIQFYFEEAHNLFPKKDDKDLSQIYNRLAKEGAKLNLGMMYATQEVSSISSNILKNTQNWFIAHLNNEDEVKELRKYYDFADFTDSLIRFSAKNDKGFVRMKTNSNPFIVPVQIDRFTAN